ncbi:MAG: peptidoglycan DD-metalloendopeptidase family protein [Clostridia bacterium]|nr:peptidoglycan DD-metalloendopeptidase family protein [Clostridia bacterium]
MNKENNERIEKIKDFIKDKGVYLVLMLCMAVIGIAAAAAYLPPRGESQPSPVPEQAQLTEQASHSEDESLSALLSPSPTPKATAAPVPDVTPDPSPAPKATATPQREKAVAPVEGKLQWRFAVNELIYSRTLDQWMTHRGIDIASPKGTEVRCPWAGTVEEVYEDDSLGYTVKMAHSGGICSYYSNLRSDCPVKEGDLLNAGALVGYVGNSAISECSDPAHLHFEVTKDGEAVNPEDFVVIIG